VRADARSKAGLYIFVFRGAVPGVPGVDVTAKGPRGLLSARALSRGLLVVSVFFYGGWCGGFTNPMLYLPAGRGRGPCPRPCASPSPLGLCAAFRHHLRRLRWPRHRLSQATSSQLGNNTPLAFLSQSSRGRFQIPKGSNLMAALGRAFFLGLNGQIPQSSRPKKGSGSCSGRERPSPTKKKAVRRAENRCRCKLLLSGLWRYNCE
jgi:hypothetical protein